MEQSGAAHPVGTDAVMLGAWADVRVRERGVQPAKTCTWVLDIGTGTGVVALMLAQRLSDIQNWAGIGVEIHPPSAALARANFSASPWAGRLEVWEGAVQAFAGERFDNFQKVVKSEPLSKLSGSSFPRFDLIVSNPPFFSERTISPNPKRSLGRHTATLSPSDLLEAVGKLLAPDGRFCAILPEREGRHLCELAVPLGLFWTRITEVRSRPGKPVERLLLQFEKSPCDFQREGMSIYAGKNGEGYSAEFQEMTRDFYLAG
ncbi:MAG: tRNA1(Val) (adenine(37)-N6)-methyltransferase [Saprospiraceae bacterium]